MQVLVEIPDSNAAFGLEVLRNLTTHSGFETLNGLIYNNAMKILVEIPDSKVALALEVLRNLTTHSGLKTLNGLID